MKIYTAVQSVSYLKAMTLPGVRFWKVISCTNSDLPLDVTPAFFTTVLSSSYTMTGRTGYWKPRRLLAHTEYDPETLTGMCSLISTVYSGMPLMKRSSFW